MGVDPLPFTLKELFWMYEGADRQRWLYVASIETMQATVAGAKKVDVQDYHPYMKKQKWDAIHKKLDKMTSGRNNNSESKG